MNLSTIRSRLANDIATMPTLAQMRDDMNRFVDQFALRRFASVPALLDIGDGSSSVPAIDLSETDTAVLVRAEVPGMSAKDIDVSVSDDRLVISGTKTSASESKTNGWIHRETGFGAFNRSILLPTSVDPDKVSACCEDGVLTVTLTKVPTAKTVKVPVKSV
jgi:HSP20 family protein